MFHFAIRDVLWLTVVVALGCALWVERSRHQAATFLYEDLKSYVLWCPDDKVLVWHGGHDFRYEPRKAKFDEGGGDSAAGTGEPRSSVEP